MSRAAAVALASATLGGCGTSVPVYGAPVSPADSATDSRSDAASDGDAAEDTFVSIDAAYGGPPDATFDAEDAAADAAIYGDAPPMDGK